MLLFVYHLRCFIIAVILESKTIFWASNPCENWCDYWYDWIYQYAWNTKHCIQAFLGAWCFLLLHLVL